MPFDYSPKLSFSVRTASKKAFILNLEKIIYSVSGNERHRTELMDRAFRSKEITTPKRTKI